MKLQKLGCVAGTVLAILFSTGDKSQAVTILLQNASLATPPAGTTLFRESADGGLTNPGDVATLSYNPGISALYAINDSKYNFTSFTYTILDGNATWDAGSKFDFFPNTQVSADGKTLKVSGGFFNSGATALFQSASVSFPASNTPIQVSLTFDVTPVPEPTTIVGCLATAGFIVLKKRKLAAAKKV